MQWDQIVNAVKEFFNQPVPIIGCTIGFLLISVITIISKTSFGRKAIKKMLSAVDGVKVELTQNIAQTSEKVAELEKEYQSQLAIAETHSQELEDLLLTIADNLHNENIKKAVESYKETRQQIQTEYENIVAQTNKAIDLKVQEIQEQLESYKAELKSQYDEMVANYKAELESHTAENVEGEKVNEEANE